MENQKHKKAARVFAGAFAESLAEAIAQAAGQAWPLAVLDSPDLPTRNGQPAHYRLLVSGELTGECYVEFYEPQLSDLLSKILDQPVAPFNDEQAERLLKVIVSAMPLLSDYLSAAFGELTFRVERVAGLAFGGMFALPLGPSAQDTGGVPLMIYFDNELLENLSTQPEFRHATETEKPSIDPLNLKLVMDVELNVSLRFGQRQLPLREVLELASGSVIELDRMVDEPVELLLDGKLIARGEAVIVDGNYGLRITEIPQPMASHFTR